jgi:hypothetical protein
LEECSDVEEAIDLIKQYNVNGFKRHHIMLVDKSGASAVIEWGTDSLSVLWKNSSYQVMTNFNNTDPELAGWYPCRRFDTAVEMLENAESISVELFRQILQSVHNSGSNFPTVYSNIYDLKNNLVYVYHFHNFEEYNIIDVRDELSKGDHSYALPSLFSDLELLNPTTHEITSASSVDLVWQGSAEKYQLYHSTDGEFKNCRPIEIQMDRSSSEIDLKNRLAFFGIIPFFFLLFRYRKMAFVTIIFILSLFQFSTCQSESDVKPITKYAHSLTDLKINSIYYWKVVAENSEGHTTSSIVQTFKIGR